MKNKETEFYVVNCIYNISSKKIKELYFCLECPHNNICNIFQKT
jgi:hypothetical protein